MRIRPWCHTRAAPRASRCSALRLGLAPLLLGVLATLAGPWRAALAGPPAWMQAQVGAALPEHDPDAPAVVLYSEISVSVQPSGKLRRLERRVVRILRTEGEQYAQVLTYSSAESRVIGMHGWCIPAGGKPLEVSDRDAQESGVIGIPNWELVTDLRARHLRIPGGIPGSTVAFELEEEEQPYNLGDEWGFQSALAVKEARYSLELPRGWQFKASWLNHPEETPAIVAPNRWQWVVHDVPAIKPERQMPPLQAIMGRLTIALVPSKGLDPGFQSWSELGNWYLKLTSSRREATPLVKQKTAELTAARQTLLGKMQALAAFAQNEIRYVAIELGIGGHQPHAAADVFLHRYGDCKDKATLLISMLKEIGVDSYYVLVNTNRGAISESTPAHLGFNHAIVAVQLPAALEDPTLLAVVTHPRLGRLLIFDPTDPYTPFGALRGPLQAGFGLLVTPTGGELVKLPQLQPDSSSLQRVAHLVLKEDGELSGQVQEIRRGDRAAGARSAAEASAREADQSKLIESLMGNSVPTYRLMRSVFENLRDPAVPFEWNYVFEADHYARASGELLTVRPRVLGSKTTELLETKEPRRFDIELEGPVRDTDMFEIILPADYVAENLPPPVNLERSFGAYHSKTEFVGRTLRYTRTFEIRSVSVPVAQAGELKEFYRVILNDERMSAVLSKLSQ